MLALAAAFNPRGGIMTSFRSLPYLKKILVERDELLGQRNMALIERDELLRQRDIALREHQKGARVLRFPR